MGDPIPIESGEYVAITAEGDFDQYNIYIEDNPVAFSHNENYVDKAIPRPADSFHVIGKLRGKTLYAYAPNGRAVIHVDEYGAAFLNSVFEFLGVRIEDQLNNVAVDLAEQTVGNLDTRIADQLNNVAVDLAEQTLTQIDSRVLENVNDLTNDRVRNSALGRNEINADQTSNLADGGTQTTNVTSDSGEIWELVKIELNAPGIGGVSGDSHSFTLETEAESIEVGFGPNNDASSITYRSGSWGGNTDSPRDDMIGTRIDDTNGLDIRYENNQGGTQTNDRTIRLAFQTVAV